MITTNTQHSQQRYDPNRLMDALREMLHLDSDIALSQALEVSPLVISHIRYRGFPVGPSILIRMHDLTRLSIQELRDIMGDRRKTVRTSYDIVFFSDPELAEQREGMLRLGKNERLVYLLMAGGLLYLSWNYILR